MTTFPGCCEPRVLPIVVLGKRMDAWINHLIVWWGYVYRSYTNDTEAVQRDNLIDQQRFLAQREMTGLLHYLLDGKIAIEEFNRVFQQKTHNTWSVFHLQGMSGGLFLNKLVKHIHSDDAFGHLSRSAMRLPERTQDGRHQMEAFVQFLEGLIASRQINRAQLQPGRVPFFLSAWWHMQDSEQWPIFYFDVRRVLMVEEQGLASPQPQGLVETYFAFQTRFLALAKGLDLSSWELEHLAAWYVQRGRNKSDSGGARASSDSKSDGHHASSEKQTGVIASITGSKNRNGTAAGGEEDGADKGERVVSRRTHLQWLLAKLGQKVGCRVWIAARDRGKVYQGERLSNLSLPSLPIVGDATFQHIVCQIDVLWLLGNDVIAAYEIEQVRSDLSTSLLRLYDLGALLPTREVHLCVVAPNDRFEKIRIELSRPALRDQGARERCALISEELLLQQEAHILRWAGSPSVVEALICRVGDGERR